MAHFLKLDLKKPAHRKLSYCTYSKNKEVANNHRAPKIGSLLGESFIIGGLKMKQAPNCSFSFGMSVSALLRDKLLK